MKNLFNCLLLAAAGLGILQTNLPAAPVELLPLNATWKFYVNSLDGQDWTSPGFNDTGWGEGLGLFAFEQNAALTPLINTALDDPRLPVDGVNGHAYYFRTRFTWPSPTNNVTLRFTCRVDDCATIYLNGVLLTNMGVTTPNSFASLGRGAVGEGTDAVADEIFVVAPSSLINGQNVLAVAVHQVTTNSSDIVWGARVEGEIDTTAPIVAQMTPGPGSTVRSLTSVEVFFNEAVTNVQAANLTVGGVAATNVIQFAPHRYVFNCVQPGTGAVQIAFSPSQNIRDLAGFLFQGTNWSCTLDTTPLPVGQSLRHRYSFTGDASDSVGTAHGQLAGGATISGGSVVLNGSSAYVNLPNNLFTNLTAVTFETWLVNNGSGNWARIFDFGNNTSGEDVAGTGTQYMFLTPGPGPGVLRAAYTQNGGGAETQISAPSLANGTLKHVVLATDGATQLGRLYVDGVLVASNAAFILTPAALGPTVNNWIGRSQFSADAFLNATITEFRVWETALSGEEIAANFQAGPDVVAAGGPVTITAQPQTQAIGELQPVTFSVAYNGARPVRLQWFRNSQPISGATNDSYTISSVALSDHNAVFHVALTNNIQNATHFAISSNATLTVIADTTPPALVQALSVFPNGVSVEFTERLRSNTATNTANYVITHSAGSLQITGATLDPSQRVVTLATAPQTLGRLYTLRVSGVVDLADAANMIAPNSQATFTAMDYSATNIGNVAVAPVLSPVAGGFDLTGAGAVIGGTNDQFSFGYRLYSGDFDLQLRLGSLPLFDDWTRAGLMARANLGTNVPFAASLATPGPAGSFFAARTTTGGIAAMTGTFPANFPDSWLRLRRRGNVFEGYASLDGQTWSFLGSETVVMPTTVPVGLALSSGSSSTAITAQYRALGNGSGILSSNVTLPFEPLGPSTRRTSLVFSEIMYNPPDAWAGTNNVEFLELWNSGLATEDLTGFRLTGDISYTFPNGTVIRPGEFLVVANDPVAAQTFYGVSFLGPYTNGLGNNNGTLRLLNELGGRILEVEYDNEAPWPVGADGAGHSLVLARPSYGENDSRAWGLSDVIGGSPGRAEHYTPDPMRAIVINEFLANSESPSTDYVELFNTSLQPVNISGAWLTDEPEVHKYRILDNTTLGGRSSIVFSQAQLGFALSSDGEQVLLVNSNRTRVIDAIAFEGQLPNVSAGRTPDGAPGIDFLCQMTPGTPNGPSLRFCNNTAPTRIVFNEIMYHPISENDNDEYIELYNRGTTPLSLANWRIDGGVEFTFPNNAVIPAGGYIVVAENLTNLLAKYPQLNSANTFGNYDGALRNSGERLQLKMPEIILTTNGSVIVTNFNYITINEVDFRDGGAWGRWSDGGGSSLELIDPAADNRYGASWADSDESAKATWTVIDVTSVLENGQTAAMINQGGYNGAPNRFEFFLQDHGEAILDNLEFRNNNGVNLLSNGDFSGGTNGYTRIGTMRTSFAENGVGIDGSLALHLVATDRGDAGANKIATPIAANVVTNPPNNGTIRAQVRWLKGSPYIMFRLHGHWMEVSRRLNIPQNLGTPGLANSRRVANAGPLVVDVSHSPILPAANQNVVVSARVSDPHGVGTVTLSYRLDPSLALNPVTMNDSGTGADAVANDGIYSAIIPGQSSGMAAFRIQASDALANAARFPADPAREGHVRWGETVIGGTLGTYRLWLTASNVNFWTQRERNANDPFDATFVYGNSRVVYNVNTLYSGSPFHTPIYTGPLGGNPPDYEMNFPTDDKFLGTDDFVLAAYDVPNGNFFYQDKSGQVDITGNWIARKLGQPFNYRRHVHVIFNGQRRGTIYDDTQQPNGDWIEQWFTDDENGELRKVEDWFEFADDAQTQGITTATVQRFDKVSGGVDTKRYRWNWRPRATENPDNWFSFTNMILAFNDTNNANYVSRVLEWVDFPNWIRPIVTHHICGSWDSYSYERGKNMYAYKGDNVGWRLLMWDIELALDAGGRGTSDSIYSIHDPVILNMINNVPAFRREYLSAFQEAVDNILAPGIADPVLDERYANFLQNGVAMNSPQGIKNYFAARRTFLQTQIPAANFTVSGTNFLTVGTSNLVTFTGTAPVSAKYIYINGVAYPITWTGVTSWTLRFPVDPGTNTLVFQAVNRLGNVIPNGTTTNVVVYTGPAAALEGGVVFNEIMYHSTAPNADYIELFNTSTNYTFDLSGWHINGLDYTFPDGSLLLPRRFFVLAEDKFAFMAAYNTNVVFAEYGGGLDADGETLTLVKPGATPEEDFVVDRVRYETNSPWSSLAAGNGASVQVVDPVQDNSRAGNWESRAEWRYVTATGVATASRLFVYLTGVGDVFIDDIKLVAGTVAEAGTNRVRDGDFETPLAGNWVIPTGNQQTHISTTNVHSGAGSLHLVSTNPVVTVSAIFLQDISPALTSGQTYTLSFWYRPVSQNVSLIVRLSAGTLTTTHPLAPVDFSPGAVNFVNALLPPFPTLWLNEVLAQNVNGLLDAQNEREPWVELYNPGPTPVSLEGLFLTHNYSSPTAWAFPGGASINPGEFKVIIADGEPGESTPSELHTSFRLAANTGSIALTRLVSGAPQVVDYLNYSGLAADRSYGDFPDGQPFFRQQFLTPTPRASNSATNSGWPALRINEWMASNSGVLLDPADNQAEDWFEIYNPTPTPVNLAGWYLSDATNDLTAFRVPAGYVVPANGYLLVWADDEEETQNTPNNIDLHAGFNLRAGGEAITLAAPDQTLIDAVIFGQQTNNVSQGRSPDGGSTIVFMTTPSPRAANPSTQPTRPTATIAVAGNNVTISFNTTPGRSYRVEFKNDLNAVSWTQLAPAQVAAGTSMNVFDQVNGNDQRFYQVVLLP